MIPQHRLAVLLDHVKQSQINNCLYHNTAESPSLYCDHMCDRNEFPLEVSTDLTRHTDEVWYCDFSHDGTKLVTAGKDRTVLIYDTRDFSVLQRLTEHEDGVAFASWSPDDTKLITCSQDKKARVWNVQVGDRTSDPVMALLTSYSSLDWPLHSHDRPPQPTGDRRCLGCRWRVICDGVPRFQLTTLSLEHPRTIFVYVEGRLPSPGLRN